MVTAIPSSRAGEIGMAMHECRRPARTTKDGKFTISSVAPGDYTLNVRSVRDHDVGRRRHDDVHAPRSAAAMAATPKRRVVPLVGRGEDCRNVVIVTSKGATALGAVAFEGSRPLRRPPAFGSRPPAADVDDPLHRGGGGAAAKADGTFELKGLPGRRMLRAAQPAAGLDVEGGRLNGDDVTDAGVEFKAGRGRRGLEIVATVEADGNQPAAVTAADGCAVKDFTVVVFS